MLQLQTILVVLIGTFSTLAHVPENPSCPAATTRTSNNITDPCPGLITALNCSSAVHSGTLTSGETAASVSSSLSYTGGDGGPYKTKSINSTGVTGLTATITAGNFANGSGTLNCNITGIPSGSGTASFLISIGGQRCTLSRKVEPGYPAGTVHCGGTVTAIVDVTSSTGKVWMDRNLGASQVASSSTDAGSYGDLYQWGRRSDGHQCLNSGTSSTLSNTDQPSNGSDFIIGSPDWRSPQNNNLWQGTSGVNNPCPSGYRLPTSAEWNTERGSWGSNNSTGAFGSALKLPMTGYRSSSGGSFSFVGSYGNYWSSAVTGANANHLYFYSGDAGINNSNRAYGFSVRCLKD